jgi:phytoene dehydrogenase-like protein
MGKNYDAIIIGCGFAGMVAGSLLSNSGKRVLMLDKMDRLGGRACGFEYQEITFDYGMHLMITSDDGVMGQTLKKLGINVNWKQIPGLKVFTDGAWKDMMDLAPLDDPEFGKIAAEMMAMSEDDLVQCDDLSIEDWLRTRTSKDSILDFMRGMAMVITTLPDANDMAASEVIFSTARVLKTGKFAGVPEGGYNRLWEAVADFIRSKGGDIRLNTSVGQIAIKHGKTAGVMIDVKKDPEFFMADFMLSEQELVEAPIVIYTGMIWDLFKIASPEKFPDFFVKMVKGFTGNTTAAVGWAILAMDKPATDSLCHHAVYKLKRMGLPMQYLPITNIDPSIAPSGTHIFIGGCPCELDTKNRELMEEMAALHKEDLEELFPGIWDSVKWGIKGTFTGIDGIARRPRCVGIFRPDYKAPGIDGLYFAGDTVRSRGVGMDFASRSGLRCVEKILNKKFDIE